MVNKNEDVWLVAQPCLQTGLSSSQNSIITVPQTSEQGWVIQILTERVPERGLLDLGANDTGVLNL